MGGSQCRFRRKDPDFSCRNERPRNFQTPPGALSQFRCQESFRKSARRECGAEIFRASGKRAGDFHGDQGERTRSFGGFCQKSSQFILCFCGSCRSYRRRGACRQNKTKICRNRALLLFIRYRNRAFGQCRFHDLPLQLRDETLRALRRYRGTFGRDLRLDRYFASDNPNSEAGHGCFQRYFPHRDKGSFAERKLSA